MLIIGCNGYVSAIRTGNGEELWRTLLNSKLFGGTRGCDVSVLIDGDLVYAGCAGRIYALKSATGEILWSNSLKGLGVNEVSLAKQGTSVQFITRTTHTITSRD